MKIQKSQLFLFRRKFLSSLFLAGGLFLSALAVKADTTEIVASQNAYVLRSSATADQDESQTLSTKRLNDSNTRVAYVRFDLTSFLATHNISGITTATLRLYESESTASDTMKVYGLDSTIGGTNEFDDLWTNTMTWNNQPCGNIANSASGLPTNTTTIALASQAIPVATAEMDITLSLADFKSFLTTNGDAKITLVFHNTASATPSAASIDNTGGNLKPTLELVAPVLTAGAVTWTGANSGDWDTNTVNWTASGTPTTYALGNAATFDDSLTAHSTVNLTMPLFPLGVTVSNTLNNYTFSGAGNASGPLVKTGSGKLTIDNSLANNFSATTISNGIVQIGNGDGNGNLGGAGVTNYGTLIFNRTNNVVFANSISGTGSVIQNGSGTLSLTASNSYAGATIVNNGTLIASALATGGILTNAPGSTIAMTGSNAGAVFLNGTLAPGNVGAAGTFSAGNGLTMGSGATLSFDVGSTNVDGSGVNDLLLVNGNLAEAGTVKVANTLGAPLLGVPYTLAYFGSKSGSFSSTVGTHYNASFNQTTTNLTVTFSGAGANLKWDGSSAAWDSGITTNWLNLGSSQLDYFYQGDSVTFDDTASQTLVTLTAPMSPTAFTNNSSANYVLNGPGKISGVTGILKNGSGTLTLSNANDFAGTVAVLGGVLKLGNNSALGATNAGTIISSGAALDVFGHNIGQEPVVVSGTGPDATKGAIYNSGTNVLPAIARLTLAGDTTIGGPVAGANQGRWDLRSATTSDANGASLTAAPGAKLTKVGANFVAITGVTVDTNLGDIDIQGGGLSIESATTGLGDPTKTLTVENGATLSIFAATNLFNKNIVLNGNGINNNLGTLDISSANNTIVGPMTLNGAVGITFRSSGGIVVAGSLTLSNNISGTGSLTKFDTNTLVIAGVDSHSGGTTINDGTYILNALSSDPNNILTENISQSSSPVGVFLGGNGTNIGATDIEAFVHPGVAGHPSTLTFGDGVDVYPGGDGALQYGLNGNFATNIFDLSATTTAGGGVNDLIVVRGDLDGGNSRIRINPISGTLAQGTYTLFTYSGNLVNGFNTTVSLLSGASRYNFALNQGTGNNSQITVAVSGGPTSLKWNNNSGDGTWNVNSSQNWFNPGTAANDIFFNLDSVLLDDSITNSTTPNTSINLTATVLPAAVTNNSTTNYTIAGVGKISGATGLVKMGSSTLTLLTTNDFTGNALIAGGMVAVQNNNSLGATNGIVFITNGATLNISSNTVGNGLNFGTKQFVISGAGVNGNGAIINNWTNQQNAFENVLLAGDATIGGSARFDWRNGSPGPVLDLGGHTLTKTGNNQISLVNVIVTNTGSIVINSGVMSFETTSIVSNSTVIVNGGGALGSFRLSAGGFTDPITLNGGTITNLAGGGATNDGPITLTANSTILHASGNDLYLNGVISQSSGSFGLTKLGSGNTILSANETYTGDTLVSAGSLTLRGASLASSNIVVASGATLDVSGRSDQTLTLNNGQTIAGSGNVTGKITNNVGSTLSPGGKGIIGNLTVSGAVTLKGTTYMEATNNAAQVDKLTSGSVFFGGTLVVSNLDLANPFTTNTVLQLFSAGTYSGVFSSIVPATPGANMVWDTNSLGVSGALKISPAVTGPPSTPRITSVALNGTTLTISATNGAVSGPFVLLSSTNVALPLTNWTPLLTNTFDGNGNLNLSTNIVNPSDVQKFYILKQ